MQSILKAAGVLAALFMSAHALADTTSGAALPEPGALPLVGLAIGVAALVMRRKK